MKTKTVLIITFFILTLISISFAPSVNAEDLTVSVIAGRMDYKSNGLESAPYGKIVAEKYPFYIFGSYERPRFSLMGQTVTYFDVAGFGFGMSKRFHEFRLWADVGWYEPFNGIEDTKHVWVNHGLADRFSLALLDKYMPTCGFKVFDWYSYRIGGNYGGTIGLNYKKEFGHWFIGMSVSHRWLKMTEWISGEMWDTTGPKWCMVRERDFGGTMVGTVFGFEF